MSAYCCVKLDLFINIPQNILHIHMTYVQPWLYNVGNMCVRQGVASLLAGCCLSFIFLQISSACIQISIEIFARTCTPWLRAWHRRSAHMPVTRWSPQWNDDISRETCFYLMCWNFLTVCLKSQNTCKWRISELAASLWHSARHFFQLCLCNGLVLCIQTGLHSKSMIFVMNYSDLIV